jgi:dipeptidyl aminopeptidase/acylaminoacyl peptidase
MTTLAERIASVRAQAGDEPLERAPAPTVEQLGVGWSLHEKAPDGTWYGVRGGVVVHIAPHAAPVPDTGEMVDRYLVVRADRGELNWTSLRADQVAAVDEGCRPNAHTIRGVCQVAARELAATKRKPDDERALELFSLGARLMAVLARPSTVAP